MKNNIEDLIRSNRRSFEDACPPEGHADRFAQRLAALQQPRSLKPNRLRGIVLTALSAAAVLGIVLTTTIFSGRLLESPGEDVMEVAEFYSSNLQNEARQLIKQMGFLDDQAKSEFVKDIKELTILDTDDAEYRNMNDEEKIRALYTRYNAYMESLMQIRSMIDNLPAYAGNHN